MPFDAFDLVSLGRFDDRLRSLLVLLGDEDRRGLFDAEVQKLIDDYTNAENGVASDKLFKPCWRDQYADDKAYWIPLIHLFDVGREEAALGEVCKCLIVYAVDATTPYHKRSLGTKLDEAIRGYLSLRGHEVRGGDSEAGNAVHAVYRPDDDAEPVNQTSDVAHSTDFRSVRWDGKPHTFTALQAACVKVLWENWKQGTSEVGEQTILELADTTQKRLRKVFDDGKHSAWGTMIISGASKGTFRLSEAS